MRRLFVLDQNFPEPIVTSIERYITCAELVPIRLVDRSFARLDDWDLLRALHEHERQWDG